jgi:hypothetical protein
MNSVFASITAQAIGTSHKGRDAPGRIMEATHASVRANKNTGPSKGCANQKIAKAADNTNLQ